MDARLGNHHTPHFTSSLTFPIFLQCLNGNKYSAPLCRRCAKTRSQIFFGIFHKLKNINIVHNLELPLLWPDSCFENERGRNQNWVK